VQLNNSDDHNVWCYIKLLHRGNHITSLSQSRLNVFGGPGPSRLMGRPCGTGEGSHAQPLKGGHSSSLFYQRIRQCTVRSHSQSGSDISNCEMPPNWGLSCQNLWRLESDRREINITLQCTKVLSFETAQLGLNWRGSTDINHWIQLSVYAYIVRHHYSVRDMVDMVE